MRKLGTDISSRLGLYGYAVQSLHYSLVFKRETIPTTSYIISKDGKVVHLGSRNTVENFLKNLEK